MTISQKVSVECPGCRQPFNPPSRAVLKAKIAGAGVLGGAIIGAVIGSGMGLASGGTAAPATVPGGFIGGAILGAGAKFGADWALANVTCPRCRKMFRLQ